VYALTWQLNKNIMILALPPQKTIVIEGFPGRKGNAKTITKSEFFSLSCRVWKLFLQSSETTSVFSFRRQIVDLVQVAAIWLSFDPFLNHLFSILTLFQKLGNSTSHSQKYILHPSFSSLMPCQLFLLYLQDFKQPYSSIFST